MVAAFRALASVIMLAGFYLVALVQFGATVALVIWLASISSGAVALKITGPLLAATVGAVAVALWKAIRAKPEPAPGLVVGPDQAPMLWATVHELAGTVGTRVPDEIRVVPEVNAAVSEETQLLGLISGRRTLYIGLPLLQTFTVDQMRAVLAHELGHYSGQHTRLGAVAYRGRLAMAGTINRIGPYNPVGWIFKAYSLLYLLVDNAASRRQELEADRASVQVAGQAAAASALRELPVLAAAWGFYFGRYVGPGWEAGFVPADIFGGFAELVAARKQELDEMRAQEPDGERSRWDTHPPIPERIASMTAMTDPAVAEDGRPATVLVSDMARLGSQLQKLMVEVGERKVLDWPEFTAAMVGTGVQSDADVIYRAAGRLTGSAEPGLSTVLGLVEANRLGELAARYFPDVPAEEAAQRFAGPMATLLQSAAVACDAAYWRHSWSGPAELVGADGEPLGFDEIAALAVSPQTLDDARRRLTELGIDPARATLVERQVTAQGAGLIAGMANIKADGVEHDLLVLDRGLVLVADPGKIEDGKRRMQELIESAPLAELATQHRFLPFEEIATVTITRQVPLRAELVQHDGNTLALQESWSGELLEKNSRDTLLEILESVGGA
ncbi:MAG TPA: M48 family metallopeptidase [Micromonosporaceae bacterium]|nr:M48 family metallopeptidase [Micromonosporaceae bacterium]